MAVTFRVTPYTVPCAGLAAPLCLAVAADLHSGDPAPLLSALSAIRPDAVLFPGDFSDGPGKEEAGLRALALTAAAYPVFCSLGNHEMYSGLPLTFWRDAVKGTGAHLLHGETVFFRGLLLGGLGSSYAPGEKQRRWRKTPPPDTAFIERFSAAAGAKLLLCHHPEYYEPYLRGKDVGLIVAGHAHGGQWQIGGRGVFAPGQGLFPRYTAGLYDGRLLVSRGLCTTHRIFLRISNPREVLSLSLVPRA